MPDVPLARLRARRASACALGSFVLILAACGGGGGPARDIEAGSDVMGFETGPATRIVPVAGTPGAVVALFPDGHAYYSPDGLNLGGGGSTVAAYTGLQRVEDIVPVGSGVNALLSDGTAYYSPDGMHLGGGGRTVAAHATSVKVTRITAVGTGVDAILADTEEAWFSPDGLNLAGGGASVPAYAGGVAIRDIVPVGPGDAVVTLLADGSAFLSPDNRNLGGGGGTTAAAAAGQVERLVAVGGGVLAQLQSGEVFLSPDGRDLAAGTPVSEWVVVPDAPFPARDSAHGAVFAGRLWISGGFTVAGNAGCSTTCTFFDLWSSRDASGTTWNAAPSFETATTPNPRDVVAASGSGLPGDPPASDFYDPYSALAVWHGELTAVGATVWRSADGVHWQRNDLADGVTPAPGPLPVRADENTRTAVLGNALFVLQPDTGAVYRTTDPEAAVWTGLGAIAGFAPRCGAAVFTLGGRIWIEGGGACDYSQVYRDIWSSADGVTWTRNDAPAAWSARMWACVAKGADGVVWLATGYAPTDWQTSSGRTVPRYGANHADVWYTRDGIAWKQFKADLGSSLPDDGALEPRHAPTCFVTGTVASGLKLLVIDGSGGPSPDGANARVLDSLRSLALPAASALP